MNNGMDSIEGDVQDSQAQSGMRAVSAPPARNQRNTSVPPPSRDSFDPDTGIVIANKYRLERLLRKGGMGSVWVATHLDLETPVAIKFMAAKLLEPTSTDAEDAADRRVEARARFDREAKAAAMLRMANVVQVLDYGVDGQQPYLVMELLEGEDLGARLARVERLSVQDVSQILVPVARALQRAHDTGLVHRDLKPENIFLAKEGDNEVPKILDFGVAKALRGGDKLMDTSTGEGTVVGSAYYISPEQALGHTDIDHRSDLWSLGMMAYRALTGKRPFNSEVLLEAVVEICSAEIPKPTDLAANLPDGVDDFFERALARDLDKRFQTAREFADALVGLEAGGTRKAGSAKWVILTLFLVIALAIGATIVLRKTLLSSPNSQAIPATTDSTPVVGLSTTAIVPSARASSAVTAVEQANPSPPVSASASAEAASSQPSLARPTAKTSTPSTGAVHKPIVKPGTSTKPNQPDPEIGY